MANHLTAAGDERPPPLPLVAMPDDATLATFAAESVALARIRRFAQWAAPGRTLTATGRLRLADARELISLLDIADVIDPLIGGKVFKTTSSEELYETSVVFAWARSARVVRVVKGVAGRLRRWGWPGRDSSADAARQYSMGRELAVQLLKF
jgi:hypothetical protein